MKKLLILVAIIGLAASLSAQSLTDLAKQEKARRDGLKSRRAVVITNAALLRIQKTPAVQVRPTEAEAGIETTAEGAATEPETITDDSEPANLPSGSGAPPVRRITPAVAPNGPLITGDPDRDRADTGGSLDAQLKRAQDVVDLLTTKMASLRQQFEAQDAMVPGYVIQQQLDETNQKLVKAQAQLARIEALAAKGATGKKAPA